jgi:hypothetical protein
MNPISPRPPHQTETEFIGERQEFFGECLPPDDPSLEPRVRRGRPADRKKDPRFDPPDDEPPQP